MKSSCVILFKYSVNNQKTDNLRLSATIRALAPLRLNRSESELNAGGLLYQASCNFAGSENISSNIHDDDHGWPWSFSTAKFARALVCH